MSVYGQVASHAGNAAAFAIRSADPDTISGRVVALVNHYENKHAPGVENTVKMGIGAPVQTA